MPRHSVIFLKMKIRVYRTILVRGSRNQIVTCPSYGGQLVAWQWLLATPCGCHCYYLCLLSFTCVQVEVLSGRRGLHYKSPTHLPWCGLLVRETCCMRFGLVYCRFTRVHSPLAAVTNVTCLFGVIVCLVFVKYNLFLLINPLDFEPFLLSLLCSVSAVTQIK